MATQKTYTAAQKITTSGKTFVPRTVAPQADEKWWKVGENPCISRSNGTVLPNCFVGSTEIITTQGVLTMRKAFDYCVEGHTLEVPTIDGEWHTATVKYFGIQPIYRVKLTGSTYYCTENHRWFTCNKEGNFITVCKTSELKPNRSKIPYRMCNTQKFAKVLSVKRTQQVEGVYCVVEPITHTFTLSGGEITGNCVGYAHGRFCEILGRFHPDLPTCNAGDWIDRLKSSSTDLKWGTTPKLGAVAVWKRDGKAGHVAVVEYINSDGTVMMSESGYSASWTTRFWNSGPRSGPNWYGSPYVFQGFIYNPATEDVVSVVPYDGGTSHGTVINDSGPRYTGPWTDSSGEWTKVNSVTASVSNVAYSSAVDHPARKFVRAAAQHLGKDGQKWVKETTRAVVPGWSTAMCCAAAKECEFNDVILPGDIFSAPDFGQTVVEKYGGTYFLGTFNNPQVGDIFAINISKNFSNNKYAATRLGIVREVAGDTILTVEGDLQNSIAFSQRRIKDTSWFIRPDWTKVGGTAECTSLMASPLYTSKNSRADATLREVGFISNSGKPSITSTGIKLSAINYTTLLSGVYDAAGFSSMTTTPGSVTYDVDSTGIQPPVAKEIFEFLVGKGLSAAQAVGFLANIEQESSFDVGAVNSSSGSSGICQWLGSRKTNMIAACGKDWKNNLTGQLEFLWTELNGDESATLTALKNEVTGNDQASAEQAAIIVLQKFERPGNYDFEIPIRTANARKFWNMIVVIQNNTGAITTAGTNGKVVFRSGVSAEVGSTVEIPANVAQTGIIPNFTNYVGIFPKWNKSSVQRQLADIWDSQGRTSQYYVATISGYFLIALSPKFGTEGDIVSVVLDDGTYFNAIIGDAKGPDAKSEWGHLFNGKADIVEWEAMGRDQESLQAGLQQAGWWHKKVVKIVNYSSWING